MTDSPEREALKRMARDAEIARRLSVAAEKRSERTREASPEVKERRRLERAALKVKKRRRKQGRR